MARGSRNELDVLGILWRRKVALLVCVLLGAAAGLALSELQPVRYTAETRVFLSADTAFDPLNLRSSANTQQRFVVQQAELMGSSPILERVGLEPGPAQEVVDVTPSADSDLVVVQATADDPEAAARLADGIPEAYREFVSERVAEEVQRAVAAVTDPAQVTQIQVAAALYDDGVAVVEAAATPTTPSQPAPLRNAVLLAVLAGLGYSAFAVLSHSRRPPSPAQPPVAADSSAEVAPSATDRERRRGSSSAGRRTADEERATLRDWAQDAGAAPREL